MVAKKALYTAVAAIVVVVVLIGAAFVFLGGQSTASGYTIKANVNKDCTGTPFYVGVDIGYFKAYGINFDDQGALDYGQQPIALISGQDDIYDGHPDTIINLLAAGADVKAVVMSGYEPADGNVSQQHMHWLVDSTRNPGITNITQLVEKYKSEGKVVKIAVLAEGTCADLETKVLLKNAGYVQNQDYTIVTMSDPLQIGALKQGSIDVAVLHPPFYTAEENEGGVTAIATSMDTLGQYAGTSLLVFTQDFIDKHPDAVRAFIQAYKDSQRWSNDNYAEAGKLTADTIGLTSAVPHYYSYNGTITAADIQPWIDAMKEFNDPSLAEYKKLTGHDITAEDLFTTEFSDLWVNETAPQPLNPFNSATNQKYGWYNETNDVVVANHYTAALENVGTLETVSANDVVNHYAAVGTTAPAATVRTR